MVTAASRKGFYKTVSILALGAFVFGTNLVSKQFGSDKLDKVETQRLANISSLLHRSPGLTSDARIPVRHLLQTRDQCQYVHKIKDADAQCRFVSNTDSCENDDGFLQYNDFVFCKLRHAKPFAMVILVIWWLFCFTGLAICADDFLVVISKTLRLSPNVAGVTFLAFGNGAPDLFSAIAAFGNMKDGKAGLATGAGMFVTTVVVGSITVVKSFTASQRPFLRDVIFYLICVYWTFFTLYDGRMYLGEAVAYIALWVFYVLVVIITGSIYKRMKGNESNTGIAGDEFKPDPEKDIAMTSVEYATTTKDGVADPNAKIKVDGGSAVEQYLDEKKTTPIENSPISATDTTMPALSAYAEDEVDYEEPKSKCGTFLHHLNPINVDEWSEMPIYFKIYEVWKSPIVFIIRLTCPQVLYEEEELWNWNRRLYTLQTFIAPTAVVLLIKYGTNMINNVFPVAGITLFVGLALAILLYATTKDDEKPVWVELFGYVGFVVAMVWIYVIANEVVALLTVLAMTTAMELTLLFGQCFGVVFNISQAILGLTLLAWGNSIGDWIANVVMSRQGFPRMAFSACYGAPFFNLSLGFGIPLMLRMVTRNRTILYMNMTAVQLMLSTWLMGSCVVMLIIVPLLKFRVPKLLGLFLLVYYIAFLTCAILAETRVILRGWRPDRIGL